MTDSLLDLLNLNCDEDDIENGIPEMYVPSHYYSNEDAIKVFNKNNSLNVLSLNCQSLFSKLDQLSIYLNLYDSSNCVFHVICVQESWLSAEHDVSCLQINGYKLIYKPKLASQHGGVAYYISDALKFQILPLVINDELCDSLFIEIIGSNLGNQGCGKVILGNVYRPPRENINNYTSFTESMEQILQTLQNYPNVMILGDFNIDLLKIKEKEHVNAFFYCMISSGYFPKLTLPTRITSNSRTLIDNCFVKSLADLSDITSGILHQNISDHQPYFISLNKIMLPQSKHKFVKVATHTSIAFAALKEELSHLCSIDKFKQDLHDDPNLNYNTLNDILTTSIKKHFPTKLVKYQKHKHKKSKWITTGIINSIKFRDKLYKRLRNTPITDELHETLKTNLHTYNRILKKMIRDAKTGYYHSIFNKHRNDIKKTWQNIKEIICPTKNENELPKEFIIDNVTHKHPQTIANAFNEFYIKIGKDLADKISSIHNLNYSDYLRNKNVPDLILKNVNENDVLNIIKNLKLKTSMGIDTMSNKLLKQIKNEIIKPLTLIINQTLNTGIYPEKLKIAKIIPIYKNGDTNLIKNYRPISILPSLSKVFERTIHQQLFNHFNSNKLFYDNQYGFRRHHSTEMATLELIDRITCAMDNKQFALSIFLDLSKAFDTLDHQIVLGKLKHYGVKGTSLNLLKSYLSNRPQIVSYNNTISNKLSIETGVPQGSILGPLLFIIYLNDIINACSLFRPVIYADDTALLTTLELSTNPTQNIQTNLNDELEKINMWFKVNKLSLNQNKTKAMLFHPSQKKPVNIDIMIEGKRIEIVKEFKYLGITLDSHLSWKPHITYLKKKISKTNGILS